MVAGDQQGSGWNVSRNEDETHTSEIKTASIIHKLLQIL